jgi:hypothetical protein
MMRRGKNNQSRKSRRNLGNQGALMTLAHPPPIQFQLHHRQRLRFTVKTNPLSDVGIPWGALMDSMNFATAAATAYRLFDAVKINAVEVWCNPAVGAAPSTVAVQFAGATIGAIGDGRTISDTSMGIEPAHVRAKPARLSQAAQWQNGDAGADESFYLTAPVGSVIDVDLSFRTIQPAGPIATTYPPAGATPGELYYRGLDGLASAATNIPTVASIAN